MKKLFYQAIKFGVVGVIATLIDILFLWIFTDLLLFEPVISNIFSFLISLIFNYLLSMKFVFKSKDGLSKRDVIIIFFVLSTIGFLINEGMMYLGTKVFDFYYMYVKIFATCFVLVFNFFTKKVFIEGIFDKRINK